MHIWRLVGLIGVMLVAGCTTVHPPGVAGTGTYSHVSGNLVWTYPTDLERTWQATLSALEGLDLRIETKLFDGLGWRIKAIRANNTTIRIRLIPETTRTTVVKVKIGTFGNLEQSENLHQAIRAQLKM
jgi:Protein of unknown function (DUF3568)